MNSGDKLESDDFMDGVNYNYLLSRVGWKIKDENSEERYSHTGDD